MNPFSKLCIMKTLIKRRQRNTYQAPCLICWLSLTSQNSLLTSPVTNSPVTTFPIMSHNFPSLKSWLPQSQLSRSFGSAIFPNRLPQSRDFAISRISRNDSHGRACGTPVPRSTSGDKRASYKDLAMNGAEIWWWAMDMDWLVYGERRGGRYGQNRRGRGMWENGKWRSHAWHWWVDFV